MEEKTVIKALVINSGLCDVRNIQESALAGYDKVVIKADILLSDPRSSEILNRYPVLYNVNSILNTAEEVAVSSVNGRMEIKPGVPAPGKRTYLVVNGLLEVAPGAEDALQGYCGFSINGTVICPASLSGYFTSAKINGLLDTYPDDCIRLKRTAVLDSTFPLRARQGETYYASGRIVALDSGLAVEKLAAKNVRFATKKLLVAEGLAEALLPLVDEQAEITILPDGCAFVPDDATLNAALLRQYGGKLYIRGDLTVNPQSAGILDQVEFLMVSGDARVSRSLEADFAALHATCGQLKPVGGVVLRDKISVCVDRQLLEQAEDGVSLLDCVNVNFRQDVPAELIREKLVSLENCVHVSCTPEQRNAVELAAEEVAQIDDTDGGLNHESGSFLDGLFDQLGAKGQCIDKAASLLCSKFIKADTYKF